jgi:hypothetical protein
MAVGLALKGRGFSAASCIFFWLWQVASKGKVRDCAAE